MTRPFWPLLTLTIACTTPTTPPPTDVNAEDCQGKACTRLGEELYKSATKRDRPKAYALFERGCVGEDGAACTAQGRMARAGYAEMSSRDIASLFARACRLQHAAGCAELADHTLRGDGVSRDPAGALALYQRACQASNEVACIDQAKLLIDGAPGIEPKPARAEELLRPLCKKGREALHATACFVWSSLQKEEAAAASLVAHACDIGLPDACLDLARRTRDARGVPANPTQAAGLLLGLCQAGVSEACADLAPMLAAGQGVPASPSRAAVLWRLACEGRNYSACGDLGAAYLQGAGVEADSYAALDLQTLACDRGADPWCAPAAELRAKLKGTPKPLSQVAVQSVIRQSLDRMRACQEFAPGVQASVILTFAVRSDGVVAPETRAKAPRRAQALARCVERIARTIRFPAPLSGAMSFAYPLNFGEEL